ncbi:MAG: hypothetical protein CM1200mP31_4440 [Candidatus Neomarinimicrobiota bacterium]|nr:MAG: hypothetical protein CM1200mP31_4440 [Candidatus Neomarinimicrobiota bacterium]
MGHAGAIISGGSETAEAKITILKEWGVYNFEYRIRNWKYYEKNNRIINESNTSNYKTRAMKKDNMNNIKEDIIDNGFSILKEKTFAYR